MESKVKSKVYKYILPVFTISAIIFAFRYCSKQEIAIEHPRDYDAIVKEGVLRVATEYNSISFYVDGDTVSGFNYELIQAFAHDKGLKTEITPEMSFDAGLQSATPALHCLAVKSTSYQHQRPAWLHRSGRKRAQHQ